MSKKFTIVSAAAEVSPFSKAGGVADVARSLPKALAKLGHKVIVVTPLHGSIDREQHRLKQIAKDIEMRIDDESTRTVDFWQGELASGIPIYFIDNSKYFSSHKRIYGSNYQNTRYWFFDMAVFELLKFLNVAPDVLHCHDWQTGLIPLFLNTKYKKDPLFAKTRSLYTIHNLTFQYGKDWWSVPPDERDDGRSGLPAFLDKEKVENINFAKRGIYNADVINTVSETYMEEILTPEHGQDLHRVLQNRRNRLFGIINGIDYFDYNPATDPGLYRNYDVDSIHIREKNKRFLQRSVGLPEDPNIPIIAMAGRITEQKGYDLVMDVTEPLMRLDLQLVVMGAGDKKYESFLRKSSKQYPKTFACHLKFEVQKVTQVYAGSDCFLMPSRFEPCGLGQLISLRYGSVPIVHAVGGLTDTVTDFDPATKQGNGFVFNSYDSRDMLLAIARALEIYKQPELWNGLVLQGMKESYSWEIPAQKYVTLYSKALTIKPQ